MVIEVERAGQHREGGMRERTERTLASRLLYDSTGSTGLSPLNSRFGSDILHLSFKKR